MPKPIIGITAGRTYNLRYPKAPAVIGQQFTYVDAIERAGGVPLILPIVRDEDVLRQLYELCDGIISAGGNDISPKQYGAQRVSHTKHLHPRRDTQERTLIHWAITDDKPLLGICRGMQLMNISQGGNLYQDIPTQLPQAGLHEIPAGVANDREHQIVHQLRIEPHSLLAEILELTAIGANSYHHQAINDIGENLRAIAWAEDGIIEAIELPGKRFVLGVQSHPESLEAEIEPDWRKLFSALVEEASAT
jgi:putative glutamine amidotransferase